MIKFKLKAMSSIMVLVFLICVQTVIAADNVTWQKNVDSIYNTSIPGTSLQYKNELYAGGMDLYENKMTTDKNSADIAYYNGYLGARDIIDTGKIDFDSVDSIPDNGYSYELRVSPGHIYIVSTHKGEYAKVMIKSVLSSSVSIKYAIIGQSRTSDVNLVDKANTPEKNDTQVVKTLEFEEGSAVNISWPAFSKNDSSYDLYRSDNGGNFTKVSDFSLSETNFVDNYCLVGHTYLYKYIVYDINGKTIFTSQLIKVTIVPKKSVGTVIKLQLGSKNANINGKDVLLDIEPIYKDGRTLVPIRFITETLGAEVSWNGNDQSVTIKNGNDTLVLWLNKSEANLNGAIITMDVPAQLVYNRTMVPLRFVSENLKLKVDFDNTTKIITITTSSGTSTNNTDVINDETQKNPSTNSIWNLKMNTGLSVGTLKLSDDGIYVWNNPYRDPYSGKWVNENNNITLINFGYNHDTKMIVVLNGKGGINVMVPDGVTGNDFYIGTPVK